jgi:CRP-like cAMP-binding protein
VSQVLQQLQTNLLEVRFGKLANLSSQELSLLRLIEGRAKHSFREDTRLLAEGAEIRAPHFIVSGWACRYRELSDGRRQLMGILLPGDAFGLCARARPLALTTIVSLTPMKTVEAVELTVAWRDHARVPGLAEALDVSAAEDEYYLLCHAVRLGRQTAYERISHLFCELEHRLSTRGLSAGGVLQMPITQDTLADAVGLSVVHVNRTLQQMRREGRIELARGKLSILDLEALRNAGEFAPPNVSLRAPAA